MAIITRWRMPPDSWCGYSRTRRAGAGMPTSVSISIARFSASRAFMPWCSRTVSPICRPTVSTGLRLVIGSWKIIEIALPRMSRISGSDSASRSRPSKRMRPAILPGGSAISRRIDIEVTDLPQPDFADDRRRSRRRRCGTTGPRPRAPRRPACRNGVCRFSTSSSAMARSDRFARRGSSASRSPSPSRFTASTVMQRKIAGKNTM